MLVLDQVICIFNFILKRLAALNNILQEMGLKNYSIFGVDHIEQLVAFSRDNLSKFKEDYDKKIKVIVEDGRKGLEKEAPFDIIHVGACK
jgi:protein-L-isoaspartate O-methyltransferase